MSASAAPLLMSAGQREALEKVAKSQSAAHREVGRAKVLLDAADGVANSVIAVRLEMTPVSVRSWRSAFEEQGLADWGKVAAGRGRKASIPDDKIARIVELTTTKRPEGHTYWSCRTMAAEVGISPATVQRIWFELGLQPHRVDNFKVSNDPLFGVKVVDVVGLYLNPPTRAVVLCMDEKSQIQALDRSQASLPIVKGRAGTMTHDYKRDGTTTLFAALDVVSGRVIGQCLPRDRHDEFLTNLRTIDREVPKGLGVHLILDNYATHKHPDVAKWLRAHKRFHLHFTPTSSSWLNQVERWFRDLTDKNLRRGIFGSVPDLIASIEKYMAVTNDDPKPYVWTASAESILAKVQRARATLDRVVTQY